MRSISADVRFAPRRMCHINVFVSDLHRSMEFYNRVAGLEKVRVEKDIEAGFLSNGNSHHDIGLVQTTTGERFGLGGHQQLKAGEGLRPGLFHFGWEMENEALLVAALKRARADGTVRINELANHQISHSVYVFDPDGNSHEFYADALKEWRTIFNMDREDLVTSTWNPEAAEPNSEAMYSEKPDIRRVEEAAFHPVRFSHAVIGVRNVDAMKTFFEKVAGLEIVSGDRDEAIVLRGPASPLGIALVDVKRAGIEPGLHHFSFLVDDSDDLQLAVERLRSFNVQIDDEVSAPHKRSVFVRDPDGLLVEFYSPLTGAPNLSRVTDDRAVRLI